MDKGGAETVSYSSGKTDAPDAQDGEYQFMLQIVSGNEYKVIWGRLVDGSNPPRIKPEGQRTYFCEGLHNARNFIASKTHVHARLVFSGRLYPLDYYKDMLRPERAGIDYATPGSDNTVQWSITQNPDTWKVSDDTGEIDEPDT